MTTGRITIKTGPPVEGDDFYGREKELQYAWDYHIPKVRLYCFLLHAE